MHVEVIGEKDALTGVLEPVTDEFAGGLNPIRGDCSETGIWKLAQVLKRVPAHKTIYIYYFGDHDPSGPDIERDCEYRLRGFLPGRKIVWKRLGITFADYDAKKPNGDYELIGFPVKRTAAEKGLWRQYLDKFPDRCVEVDAIPTSELKDRCRKAIRSHIDPVKWAVLEKFEQCEKDALEEHLDLSGSQQKAREAFASLIAGAHHRI